MSADLVLDARDPEATPKSEATRRQSEASHPAFSAWVSANAGSGKTHVLARRVIRLLLAVVAAFAILVLPYHLRALWQAWGGTMPHIIGPITMLLMFLNSAINPILYALLSQNFRRTLRKGMRSLICDSVICRCKARRKTWSLSFGQIQTATATSQNP